jgi:CheY-like chemotaxis protein
MPLRLLIADDNADDATLAAREVTRAGHAVDWCLVDDEAGFLRELPGADVVICDYSMPRFSPVRALELIRDSGWHVPLVLVSGDVPAEVADRLVVLGAVGYVPKHRLGLLGQAVFDALASEPRTAAQRGSGASDAH